MSLLLEDLLFDIGGQYHQPRKDVNIGAEYYSKTAERTREYQNLKIWFISVAAGNVLIEEGFEK